MTSDISLFAEQERAEAGILTEEIVEKALDAMIRHSFHDKDLKPYKLARHKASDPKGCAIVRGALRAALLSALPDLVEACAKVADEAFNLAASLEGDTARCAAAISSDIATNIRSLSHPIPKGE